MNKDYLLKGLDAYRTRQPGKTHPMDDKCINLIWVQAADEGGVRAAQRDGERPERTSTRSPIKLETASSGIGTWMASFKDIFWGMKYILVPGDDRHHVPGRRQRHQHLASASGAPRWRC